MDGIRVKEIANLNLTFESQGRIYDKNGLCPTLRTFQGGGLQPKVIIEDFYANRERGEEENPPHVELGEEGIVNSLTTVQKDNLVMEKKINKVGQISNENSQCGTVVSDEGLSPTLSAGTHGYANTHVCKEYRIKKLTEKECFRLMGFKDSDFEKARAVNSATQIYKQAGNSIVKQVLMAIFLQMNIQGLKPWNDRNEDEIRELIK